VTRDGRVLRGRLGGAWRRTTRRHGHVYGSNDATGGAPHLRMDVDRRRVEHTLLLALLPAAGAGIFCTGLHAGGGTPAACAALGLRALVPLLAAVVITSYACALGFALVRRRALEPGTASAAVILTLLLPAATPPWQAVLAAAFGAVVGRELFGGTGRTFVHPAVVGLVFLAVAFPESQRIAQMGAGGLATVAAGGPEALRMAGITWWDAFVGLDRGGLGDTSALASALGGAVLLYRRAASWRVVAGALLGVALCGALLSGGPSYAGVAWWGHLVLGSLAFVVVFVATDPGSSALTNPGRWMHGVLVGALTVVIRVASIAHVEGAVLAALLASVFAPLLDHAAVAWHVRARRRRGPA
jgi:Na+-transporting NADH:ubiquinone oxidoreductase subunit B